MLLNVDRLRSVLERERLAAIVATSPENVTYASNLDTRTHFVQRPFQLAVVAIADPWHVVLISPIGDFTFSHEAPSWVSDHRFYGGHNITTSRETRVDTNLLQPPDIAIDRTLGEFQSSSGLLDILSDVLIEFSASSSRVAIEKAGISDYQYLQLRELVPATVFVDGTEYWYEVRMYKTGEELERIRRAVQANQVGFDAVFAELAPGVTELELERTYRRTIVERGGIPTYWDSGVGTRSYAYRPSSETTLTLGDMARIDASCVVDRYWSDLGRVRQLGEPTEKTIRYYSALQLGLESALEMVKPGVRPSELYQAAMDAVRAAGIPHYRRGHIGHGIGLEFYEAPFLSATGASGPFMPHVVDPQLEPDMIMNIELPYYEIGYGGLQIEETVRVTQSGYELLSSLSTELT